MRKSFPDETLGRAGRQMRQLVEAEPGNRAEDIQGAVLGSGDGAGGGADGEPL
jgi:hypothetical protein